MCIFMYRCDFIDEYFSFFQICFLEYEVICYYIFFVDIYSEIVIFSFLKIIKVKFIY